MFQSAMLAHLYQEACLIIAVPMEHVLLSLIQNILVLAMTDILGRTVNLVLVTLSLATMVELKFKLVQHAHAIVQLDLVVQVARSLRVLQIHASTMAYVASMDLVIHARVQVASRVRTVK